MPAHFLISLLHYVMCAVGTAANILVLVMILTKTPRNLKCYSVLLFSQTLLQTSTCITSGVIFSRVIPQDFSVIVDFSGPARVLGSHRILFYIMSVLLHGHAHYCIMLAVCFSFRYYVILHQAPSVNLAVAGIIVIYVPTAIIFFFFSQTPLFEPGVARELLSARGPSYIFPDDVIVTGLPNILVPSAITGIVWVCAPCVPCYMVIQFVGRLMYRTLAANIGHMSEKTRATHKEIIRGLIFQACLPALYTFAVVSYVVGQLNILSLVVLEYTPYMAGEVLVMTSPFITLYFVHPYRRSLSRVVSNRETTTVTILHSTARSDSHF